MKKQTRKIIGIALVISAIITSQIPVPGANAEATISDFQMSGDTLVKYTGTANTVSVPATVKTIGEGAFAENTTMTMLTIPHGVKEISYAAFSDCTALTNISISDSVETIGNAAFSNCESLTTVKIGKGVSDFGKGVFTGCKKLESITIDSNNKSIIYTDGSIYSKDKSVLYAVLQGRKGENYSVPETVKRVIPYSFYGCNNLTTIQLGSNMKEIPAYGIANCQNLKSVGIPYSVTQIDMYAFMDDVNLKEINIPESVQNIADSAFVGCPGIKINAPDGCYAAEYAKTLNNSEVTQSEYQDISKTDSNTAGNDITGNNPASDSVVAPQNTQEAPISEQKDILGSSIIVSRNAVVFIDNTKQTVQKGELVNQIQNGNTSGEQQDGSKASGTEQVETKIDLFDEDNVKGESVPKYTIIDGIMVADQAFYKNTNKDDLVIPEGITAIGEFAYARSTMEEAVIPEGVTSIGFGAFYHCDNLLNVTIPSTTVSIAPYAFDKTMWLENWENNGSQDFLIVGDGILLDYRGMGSSVEIPEGVKHIGAYAFENHKGITKVSLPDSLETIEEGAFQGCGNLFDVIGGNSVTKIKDRAFFNCPIEVVRIPASVETIGMGAYACDDIILLNENRLVWFQGDKLPNLSIEETASRLSNLSYRQKPFGRINTAVINESVNDIEKTILENTDYGFQGIIGSITSEQDARISLRWCAKNSVTDEQTIPEKIKIYQKTYFVNSDSVIQTTNSNIQEENKILQNLPEGQEIVIHSDVTELGAENMKAELSGNSEVFHLFIQNSEQALQEIKQAYARAYDTNYPQNLEALDFSLNDKSKSIPITKLGNQNMTITLKVPEKWNHGRLHIVCADENGQLEELSYIEEKDESERLISFRTNHFSSYGIYSLSTNGYGGEATVSDGQAIIKGKLDDSPDTGDFIHPKWFFVIGLFFAGVAFFISRPKKKI